MPRPMRVLECSAQCIPKLYLYAGIASRRKGATSSRTKAATFSDATPIAEAVQACCQLLGRSPGSAEAELAQRLEQNWFSTAKEAASMSEARADRDRSSLPTFKNNTKTRQRCTHHGLSIQSAPQAEAVALRVPLRLLTELRNNIVSKPPKPPAEQAARREAASTAVRENAENPAVVERIAAGSMASALEAPSLAALSGQILSVSTHRLLVIITE